MAPGGCWWLHWWLQSPCSLECCFFGFSIAEMFSLQRMCFLQPFLRVLSAFCSPNPSHPPRAPCTGSGCQLDFHCTPKCTAGPASRCPWCPHLQPLCPASPHAPDPWHHFGGRTDPPRSLWLCVVEVSAVSKLVEMRPGMDDCVTELACATRCAEGWNVQRWVCEQGNIPSPAQDSLVMYLDQFCCRFSPLYCFILH